MTLEEDTKELIQFLDDYTKDQSDNFCVDWVMNILNEQQDKIRRYEMLLGFKLKD